MLPERRKSAEEIAKLREAMGVPGAIPAEPEAAPTPQGESSSAVPEPAAAAMGTGPSLAEESKSAADSIPAPGGVAASASAAGDESQESRRPTHRSVRSLRKSEQGPVTASVLPLESAATIPTHRHSERELMELRRTQATPPDQSIAYIKNLAVPWPLVTLGYLLPLSGALLGWLSVWTPTVMEPDFPAMWMADLSRKPWLGTAGLASLALLCVLGLLLAGWFAWKKPRSRHHSGFITIISVFTVVFAILSKFSPTHGP